jgi:hypothetical protein
MQIILLASFLTASLVGPSRILGGSNTSSTRLLPMAKSLVVVAGSSVRFLSWDGRVIAKRTVAADRLSCGAPVASVRATDDLVISRETGGFVALGTNGRTRWRMRTRAAEDAGPWDVRRTRDRIAFISQDVNTRTCQGRVWLHVLEASSGATTWQRRLGSVSAGNFRLFAGSDRIIVIGPEGIVAYDEATGVVRWSRSSAPGRRRSRLIVADDQLSKTVRILRMATGEVEATMHAPWPVGAVAFEGDDVVVLEQFARAVARLGRDGRQAWLAETPATFPSLPRPLWLFLWGGALIFPSAYGDIRAVDVQSGAFRWSWTPSAVSSEPHGDKLLVPAKGGIEIWPMSAMRPVRTIVKGRVVAERRFDGMLDGIVIEVNGRVLSPSPEGRFEVEVDTAPWVEARGFRVERRSVLWRTLNCSETPSFRVFARRFDSNAEIVLPLQYDGCLP